MSWLNANNYAKKSIQNSSGLWCCFESYPVYDILISVITTLTIISTYHFQRSLIIWIKHLIKNEHQRLPVALLVNLAIYHTTAVGHVMCLRAGNIYMTNACTVENSIVKVRHFKSHDVPITWHAQRKIFSLALLLEKKALYKLYKWETKGSSVYD